jgi:hypothetical protein
MEEVIPRFVEVVREITGERGPLKLFALFERQEEPGQWDVVVSGAPVQADVGGFIHYLVDKLKSRLSEEEVGRLATIVLADPSDFRVRNLNNTFRLPFGVFKMVNCTINGMHITNGYILTSDGKAGDLPVVHAEQADQAQAPPDSRVRRPRTRRKTRDRVTAEPADVEEQPSL